LTSISQVDAARNADQHGPGRNQRVARSPSPRSFSLAPSSAAHGEAQTTYEKEK
jgi:hypothetical protein